MVIKATFSNQMRRKLNGIQNEEVEQSDNWNNN